MSKKKASNAGVDSQQAHFVSVVRPAPFRIDDWAEDPLLPAPFRDWDPAIIRKEAAAAAARGAEGEATELLEQASFLEPLMDRAGADRWVYLWELEGADWRNSAVLRWMATEGDEKALAVLADKAESHFRSLEQLAKEGNAAAAKKLAQLAIKTTRVLEWLATNSPGSIQSVFAEESEVPVMMSQKANVQRVEKMAQAVKLGSALKLRLDSKGRASRDDPAGQIAWKLLSYVRRTRSRAQFFFARSLVAAEFKGDWKKALTTPSRSNRGQAQVKPPPTESLTENEGDSFEGALDTLLQKAIQLRFDSYRAEGNGKRPPGRDRRTQSAKATLGDGSQGLDIARQAALLPDWSADQSVVERWWFVAKQCLIEAYPSSVSPDQLDDQVPALAAIVTSAKDRPFPGRSRNRILDSLRSKFYSFAGTTRQKPRLPES